MHIESEQLRRCWFLTGPTASGKSDVALLLAERLGAEIVALDSMTLYRGMDIGTAKPTADERSRVPHHLFDILEPHEEFSVAEYVAACAKAIDGILARDHVPLFVGGTGLYLRSLLRGVFEGPPADWDFRRRLADEVHYLGASAIHQRLREVDSATAERLPPNDIRRVIRALEVFHVTGIPLSEQQTQPPLPLEQRPRNVVWLHPPRDWLHERIHIRVEHMFASGLVEEVTRLISPPQPLSHTARQAIGYKEVIDWLETGTGTEAEVVALVQTRTRQFAKRQHTWFRNLEECRAIDMTGRETPVMIAERIQLHDVVE